MKIASFLAFCILINSPFIFGQVQKSQSSVQLYNKIKKLNFLGSVLYVAAHPDDENTSLISYFSNETYARVGYLSLTRGDGGQNLIGPEIRELLGVIRTEELLSARRIDGGHQFFTRANDFGYSKQPDETFEFWDKKQVLSDFVYVIRKFKPDVIINRFDHRTPGTTHGHHTASAMLSIEAFDMANDKDMFPEQLQKMETWQPKRMFFNTNWWFFGSEEKFNAVDKSKYFTVDVGDYYPLLGMSNTEISALSRSQHKSQGFGVAGKRGSDINYLEPVKGNFAKNKTSIFSGINTTWSRIKGGEEIGKILEKVAQNFDFKSPEKSLPELLKAYQIIENLEDGYWRDIKLEEIKEIIADCAGLYLQVSTNEEFAPAGQTIGIDLEAINRSNFTVFWDGIHLLSYGQNGEQIGQYTAEIDLKNNQDVHLKKEYEIPIDIQPTSPYWLEKDHSIGMYEIGNWDYIGLPETPVQIKAIFLININDYPIRFERDLIFKTTSPSKGEVIKLFAIVPKVSVRTHNKTLVFTNSSPKTIKVDVKAFEDNVSGKVRLNHPATWAVTPLEFDIHLEKKGQQKTVEFTITPPNHQIEEEAFVEFITDDNHSFSKELHIIEYDHIKRQTVLLPSTTKLTRFDVKTKGKNIGYVIGAGDDVPQSLREIGYEVTEIIPKDITFESLQTFDAVVVGIRAYDLDNDLVLHQNTLFEYVKQGGTLINQYNTTKELKTDKVAPYELKLSHDRVTEEDAEVRFLAPKHPVLNVPNKITKKDFDGWVQERGLYFPNKWGEEFTPILGMNDKGEKELKGSLLVAQYGKGYFVYTGLSFFRELPAGVSGAYRLFANLLSLGNK